VIWGRGGGCLRMPHCDNYQPSKGLGLGCTEGNVSTNPPSGGSINDILYLKFKLSNEKHHLMNFIIDEKKTSFDEFHFFSNEKTSFIAHGQYTICIALRREPSFKRQKVSKSLSNYIQNEEK
jgi:hypothetical protein